MADLTHSGALKATPVMQGKAALHAAQIDSIGPLLGSIARPYGGKLADKIGGGRITRFTFMAMVASGGILVAAGIVDDHTKGAATTSQMTAYVVGFILLFILSGIATARSTR